MFEVVESVFPHRASFCFNCLGILNYNFNLEALKSSRLYESRPTPPNPDTPPRVPSTQVWISKLRVRRGRKRVGGIGSTLPPLRTIPLGLGMRPMMKITFATIYKLYGIPYRTSLNPHLIDIESLRISLFITRGFVNIDKRQLGVTKFEP